MYFVRAAVVTRHIAKADDHVLGEVSKTNHHGSKKLDVLAAEHAQARAVNI
jgi:hypothetical protein